MISVKSISKALALKAYGSIWFVDSANNCLREHLGSNRPIFHFGDFFPTREDALAAGLGSLEQRPLPEMISLPNQSPIINARSHHPENHPLTRISILLFDDLIEKGIRVEERTIAAVDFTLPPPDLIDLLDLAPCAIHTVGEPDLKISIIYNRQGNILIPDNPAIQTAGGLQPWKHCMGFFHLGDAQDEADKLSLKLQRAAHVQYRQQIAA